MSKLMEKKNTKVMIVISDEDLIERLISNKNAKIQIVDIDEKKNLNEEEKPSRIAKKWLGTSCKVCDDQAVGYNYNVLTCAACKTFFRRYNNQNIDEVQCLSNSDGCCISHQIRRKCPKCRLKKCFSVGMKNHVHHQKRKRDQVNVSDREIGQLVRSENRISTIDSKVIRDTLFSRLSVEDWIRIQTIQSSFVFYCDLSEEDDNGRVDFSTLGSAVVSWSYVGSDNAMRFINFFRHLNEFEGLNADDRLVLIKFNIFSIFLSSKGYYYKRPSNKCCSTSVKNSEEEREMTFLDLCDHSLYNLEKIDELKYFLIELTERDPIVISLLSILLIFSPGISLNASEPSLKDPLTIHRIQCHFTEMLWNYLIDKFDEDQAQRHLIQLFSLIFKIQLGTRDLRLFFQYQSIITNTTEQIAPLMKTILHLSYTKRSFSLNCQRLIRM